MKDKIAREAIEALKEDLEEQRVRVRETFKKVGEWLTCINDNVLEFEVQLHMLFESMTQKSEKITKKDVATYMGKFPKRKKK